MNTCDSIILVDADAPSIVIVEDNWQVLNVVDVGPTGAPGAAGDSSKSYVAAVSMSGHVAVILNELGQIEPAECRQISHALNIVGITTNAVSALSSTAVTIFGGVTNIGWNFSVGPVYLGLNGQLTQLLPTERVFTKILGFATSQTIINVAIQPAIIKQLG